VCTSIKTGNHHLVQEMDRCLSSALERQRCQITSKLMHLSGEIDQRVNAFLSRPLEGEWPYVWLDAAYIKVRRSERIVSVSAIVAVAVNLDGRREVLGIAVQLSEVELFWDEFFRSLADRGLLGQNDERVTARRYMTLDTVAAIRDTVPMDPAEIAAL
jgi:hypothetical protein